MAITKPVTKHVILTGKTEIIFDRYPGDNKTELTPDQKLYLLPDKTVVLPALNIISFLTATNTESAPKLLMDSREYKTICAALLASIQIWPNYIPFLRKDKPIFFGEFIDDLDAKSGIQVVYHVARLAKGVPNPKVRPMLGLPWSLEFDLTILPHPELNTELIQNLFENGGVRLGLGTFRKAFGKFGFKWE